MAFTKGLTTNTKGVYAGGALEVDEAKASAAVTPGAIVVVSNGGLVAEAGADATRVHGVALDNDFVAHEDNKTKMDTDFATDEFVPINVAANGRFMGILSASQSLSPGDDLVCAANGELKAFYATPAAGDSRKVVAKYLGKDDVTTGVSETKRILCMFLG